MVFFAAALVDAHSRGGGAAPMALNALPGESLGRGGSPLRRSSVVLPGELGRCSAGLGAGMGERAGGLPPEMRRKTPCGDQGPLRRASTPGSIPCLSGRARLVGASKPTFFYFGSTPWDLKGPLGVAKGVEALERGLRLPHSAGFTLSAAIELFLSADAALRVPRCLRGAFGKVLFGYILGPAARAKTECSRDRK